MLENALKHSFPFFKIVKKGFKISPKTIPRHVEKYATFHEHFEKVEGIDTSFVFFGDDASIAKRLGQIAPVEFDPSLYVASSARRFNRDGVWKTNWEYTKNYFKVMFQPYDHPRQKSKTS